MLFGCFDLDSGFLGLTLTHKILSVRFVFCQSFELISTKIFVRLLACRKKVGKPQEALSSACENELRETKEKGTTLPRMNLLTRGTLPYVNRVLLKKNRSFKFRKRKLLILI